MATTIKVIETALADVKVLRPATFEDDRGSFREVFNSRTFAEAVGFGGVFAQDNESVSHKGVIRGLHFQLDPMAQAKLVRVVSGSAFDVAVDLRQSSPTFGQWVGEHLDATDGLQMWIPEGFGHGFLSLESETRVAYKTSAEYAPDYARAIRWDDPAIGIEWPITGPAQLSDKDAAAPLLADGEVFA